MSIYDEFMRLIAEKGKPLTKERVFPGNMYASTPPNEVVANGIDVAGWIEVEDIDPSHLVQAGWSLRILELFEDDGEPTLALRFRIIWKTSRGDEHQSYARFRLSRADAEALEQEPVRPPDELMRLSEDVVAEIMRGAELSERKYHWVNTFPGSDMFEDSPTSAYHQRAVENAKATNPGLLQLISPMDIGEPEAADLSSMLEVARQYA